MRRSDPSTRSSRAGSVGVDGGKERKELRGQRTRPFRHVTQPREEAVKFRESPGLRASDFGLWITSSGS